MPKNTIPPTFLSRFPAAPPLSTNRILSSNTPGGLFEKMDPTLKSAFWIKAGNIEVLVPPRVFPNNISHNPLDNQDVVVLFQSFSGPDSGLYSLSILHADKDDKCLQFKRPNFHTATLKIHKNALQSIEVQPATVGEWEAPSPVASAYFAGWETPFVPSPSMRAALIQQLPLSASSGPQALRDNQASGGLSATQWWSHNELRTQASISRHQAEPEPALGVVESIDAYSIGLLTYANADAETHIDLALSSLPYKRKTLDDWLNSASQLEVMQGKNKESNPMAISVRKAILVRALIRFKDIKFFWNIPQSFGPIPYYSRLGLIALQEDLQSYSIPALEARLYSGEAEISEGENQHEAKLTYLELFSLARHAAIAKALRDPGKVYFHDELNENQLILNENQLIGIATLPDGWKNLEVIARYQQEMELYLTSLADTDPFPFHKADQVLMQYGFNSYFPAQLLATSGVAYTRLEAIREYIRSMLLNDQFLIRNNKQENGEPGEHMRHLLMRCEKLREHGWSEAMIDYEMQAFDFSPRQLKGIFSVDRTKKENALNQHMDWLLERRGALWQHGLSEGQIVEELGWLANRDRIAHCMIEKESFDDLENERKKIDQQLWYRYPAVFLQE